MPLTVWKIYCPLTRKMKSIPLTELRDKHLTAICRRLIVKAQFQWTMHSFERYLTEDKERGDWWEYRHCMLEPLLDEAQNRGLDLSKLEPNGKLKRNEKRWLHAYLWQIANEEIKQELAA